MDWGGRFGGAFNIVSNNSVRVDGRRNISHGGNIIMNK
jgi:hypothetical protein